MQKLKNELEMVKNNSNIARNNNSYSATIEDLD